MSRLIFSGLLSHVHCNIKRYSIDGVLVKFQVHKFRESDTLWCFTHCHIKCVKDSMIPVCHSGFKAPSPSWQATHPAQAWHQLDIQTHFYYTQVGLSWPVSDQRQFVLFTRLRFRIVPNFLHRKHLPACLPQLSPSDFCPNHIFPVSRET